MKNNVRKITQILILTVLFILCGIICVLADTGTAFSVDISADGTSISVSGNINSDIAEHGISITVLNCDSGFEPIAAMTADELSENAIYLRQIMPDKNGYFRISAPIIKTAEKYTVALGVNGKILTKTVEHSERDISANGIDTAGSVKISPFLYRWNFITEAQYEAGLNGGCGGQKGFCMAYSPSSPEIMFAGTDTSGIWKSIDGGRNWFSSSVGLGCFGVVGIVCDPLNPQIAYAAVCPAVSENTITESTGIYATFDGGKTWNMELKCDFYRKHSQSLFGFANGVLYASSHSGNVYRRNNDGTWNMAYSCGGNINSLNTQNNKIYISTVSTGIIVIDENSEVTDIFDSFDSSNVCSMAISSENDNVICAATPDYIYISSDGGASWTQKAGSRAVTGRASAIGKVFFGGRIRGGNSRLYVVAHDTARPLRFSDDLGTTFVQMKIDTTLGFMSNKTGYACEPVCVNPNNPFELVGFMDGEIYRSDDGGEVFYSSSGGFSGLRVMDMAFSSDNDNDIMMSVMDFGMVRAFDSGVGEHFPLTEYKYLRYNGKSASRALDIDPFDESHVLVNIGQSSGGYVIMQSTDGGKNFEPDNATEGFNTTFIRFNRDRQGVVYAKELVSYDSGSTWSKSEYPIYAVSPICGDIVYAIADGKIYKSSDCAKMWKYLYPIPNGWQSVTADSVTEDKLYVGFYSGGMRIYENGGYRVVNRSDDGYSMGYIYCIAQDPQDNLHLIAGGVDNRNYRATDGIFESFDGGKTWYMVKGLPFARDVWKIFFHPRRKTAYISTSSGLYVYDWQKHIPGDIVFDGVEKSGIDKLNFVLYNLSEKRLDAVAVNAHYSRDGMIFESADIGEITLFPGQSENMCIPLAADGSNKVMLWNSLGGMIPYCEPIYEK